MRRSRNKFFFIGLPVFILIAGGAMLYYWDLRLKEGVAKSREINARALELLNEEIADQRKRAEKHLLASERKWQDADEMQRQKAGSYTLPDPSRDPSNIRASQQAHDEQHTQQCIAELKESLKDPESMYVRRAWSGRDKRDQEKTVVLIEYTATNSYGGRISGTGTCSFKDGKLIFKYST